MRRALSNTLNDVFAIPNVEAAPARYIATDFAVRPSEFLGVKCKKCRCQTIFASRTTLFDVPLKLVGMVPCRCGGCLNRFRVPFWRARKRAA